MRYLGLLAFAFLTQITIVTAAETKAVAETQGLIRVLCSVRTSVPGLIVSHKVIERIAKESHTWHQHTENNPDLCLIYGCITRTYDRDCSYTEVTYTLDIKKDYTQKHRALLYDILNTLHSNTKNEEQKYKLSAESLRQVASDLYRLKPGDLTKCEEGLGSTETSDSETASE